LADNVYDVAPFANDYSVGLNLSDLSSAELMNNCFH
jgi:hypothetical protein